MAGDPGADIRVLVAPVVVELHVDHLARRHGDLDRVREADELAMAMALHAAVEHGALKDVQGGEQGRGAVTPVVVGLGGGDPWSERLVGTGALQGLDPALLIDGEHDRMGERIHVETHHILDLLGKGWVVGSFEGANPMRLQVELVHQRRWVTRDDARRDRFGYIEGYYNRLRIHSALGYITPEEAERDAS